eukprot:gene4733-7274_t
MSLSQSLSDLPASIRRLSDSDASTASTSPTERPVKRRASFASARLARDDVSMSTSCSGGGGLNLNHGTSFRATSTVVSLSGGGRERLYRTQSSFFVDSEQRKQIANLNKAIRKVKAAYEAPPEEETLPFTLREKICALFDPAARMPSPVYAKASTIIAVVILLLILLSVVVFCVESLPQYYDADNWTFFIIEAVCTAVFTVELIARAATTPERNEFFRDVYTWIDIFSVIPFYFAVIIHATGSSSQGPDTLVVLRLARLIRVLRVLKLGQYSKPFQIVMFTLTRSLVALGLLVFLMSIATVLYASLVFIAESSYGQDFDETTRVWYRKDGTRSPFQSIFHVFWWAVVTLTTVGYGDELPVTELGKVVAGFTMLTGLFVLAFPVILISHTFEEVMDEVTKNDLQQQAEEQANALDLLNKEYDLDEDTFEEGDPRARVEAAFSDEETPRSNYPGLHLKEDPMPLGFLPQLHGNGSPRRPMLTSAQMRDTARKLGLSRVQSAERPETPAIAINGVWTEPSDDGVDSPSLSCHRLERRTTIPFTLNEQTPLGDGEENSGAMVLQPFDSVVCNFTLNRDQSLRPVFYVGDSGPGNTHLFHYHPIFAPALQIDNTQRLDAVWFEQGWINLYFVHLKIYLDHDSFRESASEAVCNTGLYSEQHTVHARELASIEATTCSLPQGCSLSQTEWHSPTEYITLNIMCTDLPALSRLRSTLHSCCITFVCAFKNFKRPNDSRAVASINTSYETGMITAEERQEKLSKDLYTFTPIEISVRLSPVDF